MTTKWQFGKSVLNLCCNLCCSQWTPFVFTIGPSQSQNSISLLSIKITFLLKETWCYCCFPGRHQMEEKKGRILIKIILFQHNLPQSVFAAVQIDLCSCCANIRLAYSTVMYVYLCPSSNQFGIITFHPLHTVSSVQPIHTHMQCPTKAINMKETKKKANSLKVIIICQITCCIYYFRSTQQ